MKSAKYDIYKELAEWVCQEACSRAQEHGVKLKAVVVYYRQPDQSQDNRLVFPPVCDKNSERAADEAMKAAIAYCARWEGARWHGEKVTVDKERVLSTEGRSELDFGTGTYYPIKNLKCDGSRVKSARTIVYFGYGIVGGTNEENWKILRGVGDKILSKLKELTESSVNKGAF